MATGARRRECAIYTQQGARRWKRYFLSRKGRYAAFYFPYLSDGFCGDRASFRSSRKGCPATGIEIGTLFGLSRSPSYETIHIGVPSTISTIVPPGIPSLYVSWFLSERLALGSEFSFGRFSVDDEGDDEDDDAYGFTTLYLGGRGAFFLQSNALSGPYLLLNGALMNLHLLGDEDDPYNVPHTYFSAGVGLGYQWRVGPAFVLRTEGRYRMWFLDEEFPLIADGTDEFSLFIGLGTRLGGK